MASDGKYLDALTIAVCQMTSTNDLHANFKTCKDLIEKAKARRAKVSVTDDINTTPISAFTFKNFSTFLDGIFTRSI